MNEPPIFIHSLFRAGSTYLFVVFRRARDRYWCYQESLHESAFLYRENPSDLQSDHGGELARSLRHSQIDGSYFKELLESWPAWKDFIDEGIIYDAYFGVGKENVGIGYWNALAKSAHGRPVFQECRTCGRIGAIKSQMDGYHIFLWRNPWDQWWSYKVGAYFDVANQLIIHARNAPQPVLSLLAALDLPAYGHEDIAGAFTFYWDKPLTSEQSYQVFYLLWCLALREGMMYADLMLSIDRLSDSADYRSEILARLKNDGIDDIDFSDCRIPQGLYLEWDLAFFGAMEKQVHQCLLDGGWSQQDIDRIQVLRQQSQPTSWAAPIEELAPADLAEQASRARELARRFETALAERARRDIRVLAKAESKAHWVDAKAQRVEAKAREAELALEASRQEMHAAHQPNNSMTGFRPAVSLVNWGKRCAEKSPRFKRLALWTLNRMPGLATKLRRIHIESRLSQHLVRGWSGKQVAMPLGRSVTQQDDLPDYSLPTASRDGINARQRTPLEKHFREYGGNE